MHVCYLAGEYHDAAGGGGAESYVKTMTHALTNVGHQVSVIALGKNNEQTLDGRVRVIQAPVKNLHWYLYRGLPFGKSLAQPVREIEWSRVAWSALARLTDTNPVD